MGTTKICKPLSGRGVERTDSTWWACQANRAVNVDFAGRYYNIIGNVAGSTDLLQVTSYNNGTHRIPSVSMIIAPQYRSYDGTTYCFGFGYSEANDDGSGAYPEDNRLPYTTAILHGNYDYASDSVKWDPSIADHVLPASLYLSAKPAWWGTMPWPPIGPDVTPMANKIPALVRYENGLPVMNPESKALEQGHSLALFTPASLVLEYRIARSGQVRLELFDASGRLTQRLVNGFMGAGSHRIRLDTKKNLVGKVVLCRLTSGESVFTKKVMLVR
jgi:hypothetical protein